jgi:uncharacterized protein
MTEDRDPFHSAVFDLLHRAILQRQQVVCSYKGRRREVCPYVLGHSGIHEKALVFQFAGESASALPPDGEWRCLFLRDVGDVVLRDGPWHGGAQHRSRQTCVDDVYVDVNIDVPDQPGRR